MIRQSMLRCMPFHMIGETDAMVMLQIELISMLTRAESILSRRSRAAGGAGEVGSRMGSLGAASSAPRGGSRGGGSPNGLDGVPQHQSISKFAEGGNYVTC